MLQCDGNRHSDEDARSFYDVLSNDEDILRVFVMLLLHLLYCPFVDFARSWYPAFWGSSVRAGTMGVGAVGRRPVHVVRGVPVAGGGLRRRACALPDRRRVLRVVCLSPLLVAV